MALARASRRNVTAHAYLLSPETHHGGWLNHHGGWFHHHGGWNHQRGGCDHARRSAPPPPAPSIIGMSSSGIIMSPDGLDGSSGLDGSPGRPPFPSCQRVKRSGECVDVRMAGCGQGRRLVAEGAQEGREHRAHLLQVAHQLAKVWPRRAALDGSCTSASCAATKRCKHRLQAGLQVGTASASNARAHTAGAGTARARGERLHHLRHGALGARRARLAGRHGSGSEREVGLGRAARCL